jgi:hypothetical protein
MHSAECKKIEKIEKMRDLKRLQNLLLKEMSIPLIELKDTHNSYIDL